MAPLRMTTLTLIPRKLSPFLSNTILSRKRDDLDELIV